VEQKRLSIRLHLQVDHDKSAFLFRMTEVKQKKASNGYDLADWLKVFVGRSTFYEPPSMTFVTDEVLKWQASGSPSLQTMTEEFKGREDVSLSPTFQILGSRSSIVKLKELHKHVVEEEEATVPRVQRDMGAYGRATKFDMASSMLTDMIDEIESPAWGFPLAFPPFKVGEITHGYQLETRFGPNNMLGRHDFETMRALLRFQTDAVDVGGDAKSTKEKGTGKEKDAKENDDGGDGDDDERKEEDETEKEPENMTRGAFIARLDDACCTEWSKQDAHGTSYGGSYWTAPEGSDDHKNAWNLTRTANFVALWKLPYSRRALLLAARIACRTRLDSVAFCCSLCEWTIRKAKLMDAAAASTANTPVA
jgi:hypothetical protein